MITPEQVKVISLHEKTVAQPKSCQNHRSYTVEETASLHKVYQGTVRAWIRFGLPVLNDKRPMLILDSDLVAFHQARRKKNKQKCKLDELYCVRCHVPSVCRQIIVDRRLPEIRDRLAHQV